MTIEIPSHPGVLLTDPAITVVATIDRPTEKTFQPAIVLESGPNIRIHYDLPAQPYVDDNWTDSDVQAAVAAHLSTLTK
jgi:hypothetical protein